MIQKIHYLGLNDLELGLEMTNKLIRMISTILNKYNFFFLIYIFIMKLLKYVYMYVGMHWHKTI